MDDPGDANAASSYRSLLSWLGTAAAGILVLSLFFDGIFARKRLPGPWLNIPLLGDTIELAFSDPARMLFSRFKRYGRVFRMRLLGFNAVVVADHDALRPLLSDDGATFTIPVQTFHWLMERIGVQQRKEIHGPWRKLVLTAVAGGGLKAILPQVRQVMENRVRQWEADGRVSIFEEARRMGLDLSIHAITGVNLEGKLDMDWFKEQMSTFLAGIFGLPVVLPGSKISRALAAKERLLQVLMPLLEERHKAFQAEWEAADEDLAKLSAKIAESGEQISFHKTQMVGLQSLGANSLRDAGLCVLQSVMAAADTTRFALFNTWALLAQLPAVQEKIYEEQKKVIAEFGPEISFRALGNMPYLDAVFKEAMRVLPATSGGFRKLTRDATINGFTLAEGTVIWYHALLLQTLDPVLWDGDTSYDIPPHMDWRNNLHGAFQPERWLGVETQRPRNFYVFGSGTHLCAGMNLVLMEVKLLLALVMRRSRLRLEVPDMLLRAEQFPYIVPAKGTDGMRLIPRGGGGGDEAPLPWS